MYGLSDEDLRIQATARAFADELIPLEVTAEMNGGELPKDVVAEHAARARELGALITVDGALALFDPDHKSAWPVLAHADAAFAAYHPDGSKLAFSNNLQLRICDLREGKVTLPLIYALETADAEERKRVETVLADGNYDQVPFAKILQILNRHGSIEKARERAQFFTDKARQIISEFPESPHQKALLAVTGLVTGRDH